MNREEIFEGLKEILKTIKPKIDSSNITENTMLTTDLCIDSLSMLLLSLAVEDKYKVSFDAKDTFTTVGDVISFIEKSV